MRLINPTYKYRKSVYCNYCGSKKVVWEKYYNDKGEAKYRLIDIPSGEPHYKSCTSQREHASFK